MMPTVMVTTYKEKRVEGSKQVVFDGGVNRG